MAKILITGSNGFIGKRLVYRLLDRGHEIYALTRMQGTGLRIIHNEKFHLLYGDLQDSSQQISFPSDIEAAYYLIHSLASIVENLVEEEKKVAQNFLRAIESTSCKQIIFLGGIIEDEKNLSPHLTSRLAVEEVLKKGRIASTILRSSIIIGAGSASFEIIRDLVEKIPIMVAPRWVNSICQPISIRDVLFYLEAVILLEATYNHTYDIGGSEALSFKQVLIRYAQFRKLKRIILTVPCLTPKLSSYWLVLITSVRYSIARYLVESMKQNTRKLNSAIDALFSHRCLSFEEALQIAFQKISQNEVVSTWMDAWNFTQANKGIDDFIEVPEKGCLKNTQIIPITIPLADLQNRIWSIGGNQGWYSMNWAWRLRGLIDQLVGGTGFNRGRRDPHRIQPGDSIDFWRVILANEESCHLILYAEMKVPGEAWLEFEIDPTHATLKQTATFRPSGLWGRLYWYSMLPFHYIIFRNMAKALAQKPG